MKKLTVVVVLFAALMAIVLILFVYTGHRFKLRQHKLEQTFATNRPAFEQLSNSWYSLPQKVDRCGKPDMPSGLVHFATLERRADGRIRVSQDDHDENVASVKAAASLLKARTEALLSHFKLMDSVSVSMMNQHDAELRFVQDNDPSLALIYVPPVCKQFSNYAYWAKNGNGPFAILRQITPSWFLAEENR